MGRDATLLAQAKIKRGLCTYAYSPEMRRRLHNPRIYAKINLSMQNRFTSKHALALYEMFVDYFNVRRHYGETPFIPVDTFRELMGFQDGEYSEFKILNRWVIKEPLDEINMISQTCWSRQSTRKQAGVSWRSSFTFG